MIDFSPLRWGEGDESSEPGEGFLPPEPRKFGIRDYATSKAAKSQKGDSALRSQADAFTSIHRQRP